MRALVASLFAVASTLPVATVIHCGKLLDVRKGALGAEAVIVVDGRTITAAGPAAGVAIPPGSAAIECAMQGIHEKKFADALLGGGRIRISQQSWRPLAGSA
jgi:hypothetical protein